MPTVPLGVGAYKRTFGGEPEVKLVNRFLEVNPTNTKERIALLARCGTNPLTAGQGQYRGSFSKLGLFDNALFFVCGTNLYRWDGDAQGSGGTLTAISGIVNEGGTPYVTWMKGIGYEYLFIADGLLLQYYAGGTHAMGTLTLRSGSITNQVIEIDGVYYSWNTAVDTNSPDGSEAHPWLANPTGPSSGGDPLVAMANLINFQGIRGQDFSTALGGPALAYSAFAQGSVASGTLTVDAGGNEITNQVIQIGEYYYSWNVNVEANSPNGTSTNPYLALLGANDTTSLANMVLLLNYKGTPGYNYSAEVTAANSYATATATPLTLILTALGPGDGYNSVATLVTSGADMAWGNTTLTGGGNEAASILITATADDTSGNTITTSVASNGNAGVIFGTGSLLGISETVGSVGIVFGAGSLYGVSETANLYWGSPTLIGGGVQALQGVTVPAIAASDNTKASNNAALAVCNISSYVLVSISNSQAFYWILPGEVVIDPLNFAEKESNPDNIIDMLTVGDQVVIVGQGSTENWYATGNFAAPFAPIEGRVYARGTVSGTACVVKDSVILVGDDGIVYEIGYSFGETAQWGVHRISNHGIEERIRTQLRAEQGLT